MSEQGKHMAEQTKVRSAPGRDPKLERFSRYGSAALLFLVFCAVMVIGVFVIHDLHSADVEAQKMYAGSVRGLRRTGELQYEAQETRRCTFYALSTNDSNLQVEYADQSREADRLVSEGVIEYLQQTRTPNEIEVGMRLQHDWSAYLNVRDEVLASILEGSTREAVDLDLARGAPSFDRVRQDLEEIKRLYEEQASQRLANVDATSRRTVVRVIGVLGITLLFAIAAVWAIQRSAMLSAIQLAKVQMEFVASVSHELRTPLAVISSAADNIADGVVNGKEDLRKYGSVIQSQSRQVTELVNQVLLFASIKDGKNRYVLRPLKVSQIIDSAVDKTAAMVQGAGFEVEQHVDTELPCVMGDLSALSQCLQNLIVNAVKYSGEGRWIGIRAFVHSADRSSKEVRIAVQDHGIGINDSEISQIFEPFYRSAVVSDAQIHGTGLGLSLAKNIAEAMGGRLSAVSELSMGSVFTLHLPIMEDRNLQMAAVTGPSAIVQK
jgi:signal transduction histidine kinase